MLFENTLLVIFYPNDKPDKIRIGEFILWLVPSIRYIHLLF